MFRFRKFKNSQKSTSVSGGSSVAGESNLYQRPYTPSIDYTPTVDYSDYGSREFQSLTPSEFSANFFNKKCGGDGKSGRDTPTLETLSSNTNSDDARDSSPSRDSGVGDVEPGFHLLERDELGIQTGDLCLELKTVTTLSREFLRDVVEEKETPADLLKELETKIRPCLITLDEEMSVLETLLRRNMDRSRISESRVSWLLLYTRFTADMRRVLTGLSIHIFENLEQVLRLRSRGCLGLVPMSDSISRLEYMIKLLNQVSVGVKKEKITPEEAYD